MQDYLIFDLCEKLKNADLVKLCMCVSVQYLQSPEEGVYRRLPDAWLVKWMLGIQIPVLMIMQQVL